MKVNYVRLERPATESWITFHLDRPAGDDLEERCKEVMPSWEWNGAASLHDPDNDEGDLVEPWRDEAWDGRIWQSPVKWD